MTAALIKRRDKVVAAWLNQVCPVVDPVLNEDGRLTFENAAVAARAATPPENYRLQWFRFDNSANTRTPAGEATSASPVGHAPAGLLESGEYIGVGVSATHAEEAGWARPAVFVFRRSTSGWSLVGVERG
jgi:hypothetical protein